MSPSSRVPVRNEVLLRLYIPEELLKELFGDIGSSLGGGLGFFSTFPSSLILLMGMDSVSVSSESSSSESSNLRLTSLMIVVISSLL